MALSTGEITVQQISVRKASWAIHWIKIYPVDSVIRLLNYWDQKVNL